MTSCVSIAAARFVVPGLAWHAALNDSPTLVLVDAALRESCEHAAAWGEDGEHRHHIVEIGGDVGALWYMRLRDWAGMTKGALRPSDCFVLRTFAIAEGRSFHSYAIDALSEVAPPRARAIAFAIEAPRRIEQPAFAGARAPLVGVSA